MGGSDLHGEQAEALFLPPSLHCFDPAAGPMFVTDAAVTDPPHDFGVSVDGGQGSNIFRTPAA